MTEDAARRVPVHIVPEHTRAVSAVSSYWLQRMTISLLYPISFYHFGDYHGAIIGAAAHKHGGLNTPEAYQ